MAVVLNPVRDDLASQAWGAWPDAVAAAASFGGGDEE